MKTAVRDSRFLRSERSEVLREAQVLQQRGNLNSADQRKFDGLMAEAESLKTEFEALESRGRGEYEQRGGAIDGGIERRDSNPSDREYREAFGGFLRHGVANMAPEARSVLMERRDMGVGVMGGAYPGSTSGFFVPVGFQHEIAEAMKYFGPMLHGGPGYPRIIDTATGNPLAFPASDDTMNVGEQLLEGQQTTTADATISQVLFGAWIFSTKLVKISLSLLQDSAFDLESYLISEFSRRVGRIVNSKLTVGQGIVEPMGILTAAINGGNLVAAVGSSSNDGSMAGPNTIGSDDLIGLEHAIDPLYRPGAMYMMHDTTLRALKHVKDKFGRPLWLADTRDGQPAQINGYSYAINNDLPQLQTFASSPVVVRTGTILFGQMSTYAVRRVRDLGVLRLSERFADFNQVAFVGYSRFDGQSLDVGHRAISVLTNSF